MERDFGQDAAQLITKGRILFYGYNVVLCPTLNSAPLITVDFKWNCYCINLPNDAHRQDWLWWIEEGLKSIYKGVICHAENRPGNAAPEQ